MDSEGLRTFLAIHRAGGFSSAAEVLNRSQPAISRRIALLEQELGAPLFERAAGGVVLSQAGRVLLPHAERAVATLEDCTAALATLRSGVSGPLDIATVGTLAGANLTPILKRFASEHPGVALSLRTATSTEVSNLVRQGQANIGLRYHPDTTPDLECETIGSERLQVVSGSEHRLAGGKVRSLRDLAGEHWLAFPDARELRETSADNLFTQFLVRGVADIQWTPIDSLTAQKRLVEAGFGIALLPESAIVEERANGSLAVIDVADLDAANPVCLVVRRQGYLSPAAQALMSLLRTESLAGPATGRKFGAEKRRA
ncbi:MAG: LysR family transcriptional regulator [Proteobacteria bacterium]|nr:LysR family transcriptional regulator [Pseudomonadota bacterium]